MRRGRIFPSVLAEGRERLRFDLLESTLATPAYDIASPTRRTMDLKVFFKFCVFYLLDITDCFVLSGEVFAQSACADFAVALIPRGSLPTRRSRHCDRVNGTRDLVTALGASPAIHRGFRDVPCRHALRVGVQGRGSRQLWCFGLAVVSWQAGSTGQEQLRVHV